MSSCTGTKTKVFIASMLLEDNAIMFYKTTVTHIFVLTSELYGFLYIVIQCKNLIVIQHPKACMN